ncbi:MAG: hypothetical protein CMJ18_16240 [Phycisphaeraceae bacterium]|nr:hypothetical protein [Phycisphaeraceae bacterium]
MSDLIRRAQSLIQQGRLDEAERLCLDTRAQHPGMAAAWYLPAMLAHRRGDHDEAADQMAHALQIEPGNPEYQAHASEVFRRAGRLEPAVDAARAAVRLAPDHPAPRNNLGLALQDRGELEAARAAFLEALELRSDYARAHHNLGGVLRQLDRLDDAEACFRRALHAQPDYAPACNALGVVLKARYRHAEAVECLRRALKLRPRYAQAHLNLGNTLAEQDQPEAAERHLRAALEIDPDYVQAWHDLGALMERNRDGARSVEAYHRAAALAPEDVSMISALENARRHICDWSGRPDQLDRLLAATDRLLAEGEASPIWPLSSCRFPTSGTQRRAIAEQHARQVARQAAPDGVPSRPAPRRDTGERLRVGFLSHELLHNVVGHLMQGLFERFDRDRLEIVALDYSKDDGSAIRRRIVDHCERFLPLRDLSPSAAADRIAESGIHVLVDINPYMPGGRPHIAALHPAPVQVSYMYPATTGADFIDYFLTDRVATPPGHEAHFRERLVYLPHCYLPTGGGQPIADPGPDRAACGLPDASVVFCSFNSCDKIEPDLYDVWMRILGRVPGSVLWQRADDPAARENLRREADRRHVATERLVFADRVGSMPDHLARHRCADLFLDTLTHGGHGTAVDALWAGLPLLTCPRDTFTSRVAASLLRALGFDELIVDDLDAYEERAVDLATSQDGLANLRAKLARQRTASPLFDTDRFVRNLERAFLTMWEIHESGADPATFSVWEPGQD